MYLAPHKASSQLRDVGVCPSQCVQVGLRVVQPVVEQLQQLPRQVVVPGGRKGQEVCLGLSAPEPAGFQTALLQFKIPRLKTIMQTSEVEHLCFDYTCTPVKFLIALQAK